MMRGDGTVSFGRPRRCRSTRQQRQRDHDDDRRDEDQRLSTGHAPHRAPPWYTELRNLHANAKLQIR
jgi:hypothetical protein